jgi:hypothetical protein
MGLLDKISKSWEDGKLQARKDAAERQTARHAEHDAFNRAMEHYESTEKREADYAREALRQGDFDGYKHHRNKADYARRSRDSYPDPK